MSQRTEQIKPKITPEFLATLVELGKISGWTFDYVEVAEFIRWCHYEFGYDSPEHKDLEPYTDEEE